MAKSLVFFFLALSYALSFPASATTRNSDPKDFIVSCCKATRYPALCVDSLSSYAGLIPRDEQHLALTALSVSQEKAKSAADFVAKMISLRGVRPRERQALKDCIVNMRDCVDRLSQSVKELGQMGQQTAGHDFVWHMSNVQTWASAALTGENTCLDGFARPTMDGNIKVAVRGRIANVAQCTSNALALVDRFAAKKRGQGH